MKKIIYCYLILILVNSSQVYAQDVYNFYFQKGKGQKVLQNKDGQTVIQSTEKESGEENSSDESPQQPATEVVRTKSKPMNAQKKYYRGDKYIEVSLMSSRHGTPQSRDPGLVGRQNFDGSYSYYSEDRFFEEAQSIDLALDFQLSESLSFNLGLGTSDEHSVSFLLHPLKLGFFNHNMLEIAIGAGYGNYKEDYSDWGGEVKSGFTQARVKVNLTESIGIVGDYKKFEDDLARVSAGLAYKF